MEKWEKLGLPDLLERKIKGNPIETFKKQLMESHILKYFISYWKFTVMSDFKYEVY